MINKTVNVVFRFQGEALDAAIRDALSHAAHALVDAYRLDHIDLTTVSTRTNFVLAFSKFAKLGVLKSAELLGEAYVRNIFTMSQSLSVSQSEFEKFLVVLDDPNLYYSKAYVPPVRKGLGLFLIALHSAGAITLPMSFKWPSSRNSDDSNAASLICCRRSEVLFFVRSIDTVPGRAQDPAFKALRSVKKRVEWFATYATKVVLACGWNRPEDANIEDLIEVYKAQADKTSNLKGVYAFNTLISVLFEKFGKRLNKDFSNPAYWDRRVKAFGAETSLETKAANTYSKMSSELKPQGKDAGKPPVIGLRYGEASLDAESHFSRLTHCSPGIAYTMRLRSAIENAMGDFEFETMLGRWIRLEEIYTRQKRESLKQVQVALGYFNLYLFYYLPYWYLCSRSSIPFPATPDQLIGSVFVSRIIDDDPELPRTLMDFMNARAEVIQWEGSSYYGILKQIEIFFDFIIRHDSQFEGASNFKQPLSKNDYPRTHRSLGTNKIPLPRRYLSAFIAYQECFRTYVQYVADQRIEGNLTDAQVAELVKFPNFVDTKSNADNVGFVPVMFIGGKTVPLRWLPGFPQTNWVQLKNGELALLPHPHALNQNVVAVYTGVRHNHIQWLDAKRFDSYAHEMDGDYTRLLVNTDKIKKKPWLPEVNVRVIHVLRDQLRWREAIDEHGFSVEQYYNNNPHTAYPKFLPLFSYYASGVPHSDDVYAGLWQDTLLGFQSFILEHVELVGGTPPQLCKLLPKGAGFHDRDGQRNYDEFASASNGWIALRPVTPITPHSARVSVVSEMIRFLPAALIGSQITGQTEGTVYHYVVADADEIKRDQAHQAMHLRELARKQQAGQVTGLKSNGSDPYIKADQVNSNLAKSMRVNVSEALARYGCISLSVGEMETGLEVLEKLGIGNAAFNKTEICPYGNHCPPALIKELRGIKRCGICPYAVRSIDHLPAVCAKQKQFAEMVTELDIQINGALSNKSFTANEVDVLEEERQRKGEELAGWELSIEILEQARRRIASGEDNRKWVVERPEILIKQLEQVSSRSDAADYLLARLAECTTYPGFQSPKISRQFDMLRRRILAQSGASLDELLSLKQPIDSAAECAGLIRSLAAAHKLTSTDIAALLANETHLDRMGSRKVIRIANG